MEKPRAAVCDLDGTLCDFSHRRKLLDADNIRPFHDQMEWDDPNQMVISFLQYLRFRDYKIVFISARPEEYRDTTRRWLATHCPGFEQFPLFLRGRQDARFDHEVKKDIFLGMVAPHYDVKIILEDRDHVVNMWRNLGLECWQVANGNY